MYNLFDMSLKIKIGRLARFFILFFVFSCKNGANEYGLKNLGLTYSIDTVSIGIKEFQLSDYSDYSIFTNDSLDYFYGYNKPRHRIDIFSLSDRKYLKSISLNTDGPDAVGSPFDFFIHKPDSIFFYGGNYSLDIINEQGVLVAKNLLSKTRNSSDFEKQKAGYLSDPISFKLYFIQYQIPFFSIPTLWSQSQTKRSIISYLSWQRLILILGWLLSILLIFQIRT